MIETVAFIQNINPRFSFIADQGLWTPPSAYWRGCTVLPRLKNHEAAGTDNILLELYKLGGDSVTAALTQLLDLMWNQQAIPSEWKTAIIVPAHKTWFKKMRELPGYLTPERCLQNLRKYDHRSPRSRIWGTFDRKPSRFEAEVGLQRPDLQAATNIRTMMSIQQTNSCDIHRLQGGFW